MNAKTLTRIALIAVPFSVITFALPGPAFAKCAETGKAIGVTVPAHAVPTQRHETKHIACHTQEIDAENLEWQLGVAISTMLLVLIVGTILAFTMVMWM